MAEQKLKMSSKKFTVIMTVVVALVAVLAIAATIAMNFFSLSMDIFLGRGEAVVSENPNMASADTNYYDEVTTEEANEATDKAALSIAQEGEVLLKNNDDVLPIEPGSTVTPFGYRYLNPVYSGGGSASINTDSSRIVDAKTALSDHFTVNTEVEQALEAATPQGLSTTGYEQPQEEGGFEGGKVPIAEYDPSVYSGHEASMAGTTGVVFIGRTGSEGGDIQADVSGSAIEGTGYADGTAHQLALTQYEKEMIRIAKANCDKVVVVLECANTMEISDLVADDTDISVDAILWTGIVGNKGLEAMGQILAGEVNPSGHTVDTWATDLMATPAMTNFGNYEYDNLYLLTGGFPNPVGDATEMNMVEYEEGIYVGYRYYETADDLNSGFTVFGETGKSYDDAVVFPFGYGLSYGADFSQKIADVKDDGTNITITVTVTNNGTTAAKDAVELYSNPPYTEFDAAEGVEKSTVNLVAFDKTGLIEPGKSQEVTLTLTKESLASYCTTHKNSDGTEGAYVLEAGDYVLSINSDAHTVVDSTTITVASDIWYDSDNPRQSEVDAQAVLNDDGTASGTTKAEAGNYGTGTISAHNLFSDLTEHMESTDQMSRASGKLENTTTAPTAADLANIPEGFNYEEDSEGRLVLQQSDVNTDSELGNVEGSKVYTTESVTSGASNGLSVSDMRGKDYNDPAWDSLLDQIDYNDSNLYLALAASYDQTAGIESVGKPATVDFDGPMGIVGSITDATEYEAFPCEPIVAATFNVRLAKDMGTSIGMEAAAGGVNGLYAPAMNIHRTAFGGRNFEYYSEDPTLSGYMGAYMISGASEQGLWTTAKHFALNEQEQYDNDRSRVSIWANEQAIREIYLRPFEIAVKTSTFDLTYLDENGQQQTKTMRACMGVMNCMNYWGTTWGGADYALNTELLRHEWGFEGTIITDMVMNAGSNSVDSCLRSGSDTWMAWGDSFTTLINDTTSATGQATIRRAVKDMCYMTANTRATNGMAPGTTVTYKTSPWRIGLVIGDIVAAVIVAGGIFAIVRRRKDAAAHPELYKADKAK